MRNPLVYTYAQLANMRSGLYVHGGDDAEGDVTRGRSRQVCLSLIRSLQSNSVSVAALAEDLFGRQQEAADRGPPHGQQDSGLHSPDHGRRRESLK